MAREPETCGGRLQLARHPRSPGEARRFVECALRRRRLSQDTCDRAMLVSSELVTNAFRHGEGQIELRCSVLEDRVRIEVVDEGHGQTPSVRKEGPGQTGGWGLHIVDQLALQWGVYEGTTHVWMDLALA